METGGYGRIDGGDWPVFGWSDDVRPALTRAIKAGEPSVLATLCKVEGSAPRGPGAQMLFTADEASGYFSGDCIEGDVAGHAAQVFEDGSPKLLHYGTGSPWIDIRLRCGGALFIVLERIAADNPAAHDLLENASERRACTWSSDGIMQTIEPGEGDPLLTFSDAPLHFKRRYDPPRRVIVTGGDPGALAVAKLAADAQFETILIRPGGPQSDPPFAVSQYLREEPADALPRLGVDRWTAYVGATHEDEHDLAGCLYALQYGAGFVGMIGAKSRSQGRRAALESAGATQDELARLRFSPGIAGLGKSPWEVGTGIMAQVMQALNPDSDRV